MPKSKLSASMTLDELDNGYWYAVELKAFARELGVPHASTLRKDELEREIRHFLQTGGLRKQIHGPPVRSESKDSERGLALDLVVVRYVNDRATKDFLQREAARIVPGFRHASGTRYLLNRWREEQMAAGRRLTYGDLVKKAIELNETKSGPLRTEHGRYNNFTSDFFAKNPGATQRDVARAWAELKRMDVPKTYEHWQAAQTQQRQKQATEKPPTE